MESQNKMTITDFDLGKIFSGFLTNKPSFDNLSKEVFVDYILYNKTKILDFLNKLESYKIEELKTKENQENEFFKLRENKKRYFKENAIDIVKENPNISIEKVTELKMKKISEVEKILSSEDFEKIIILKETKPTLKVKTKEGD